MDGRRNGPLLTGKGGIYAVKIALELVCHVHQWVTDQAVKCFEQSEGHKRGFQCDPVGDQESHNHRPNAQEYAGGRSGRSYGKPLEGVERLGGGIGHESPINTIVHLYLARSVMNSEEVVR